MVNCELDYRQALSIRANAHAVWCAADFSGCDNAARMYDLNAGGSTSQQVAVHDAPIKCVEFIDVNGTQVLATAGWDKIAEGESAKAGARLALTTM